MKDRYIIRKQFLDRPMSVEELEIMAAMLRQRFVSAAGQGLHQMQLEALIYPIARSQQKSLAQSLGGAPGHPAIEAEVQGELKVVGNSQGIAEPPDISPWRTALLDPAVLKTCLRLSMSFTAVCGPLRGGRTTVVLCGNAAPNTFALKAIWPIRRSGAEDKLYRATAWAGEWELLQAFGFYAVHRSLDLPNPALPGTGAHGRVGKDLFVSVSADRKTGLLARQIAEFPEDRGPKAFLIRILCLPLAALFALSIVVGEVQGKPASENHAAIATGFLWLTGVTWIIGKKIKNISRRRSVLRAGLGKLYAQPLNYHQEDFSDYSEPGWLMCCAELEAMGAQHMCDFSAPSFSLYGRGARIYAWGNANVMLTVMEKTGHFLLFPGKPVIAATTHFADGRDHSSVNGDGYQRLRDPLDSKRCLTNSDSICDILELHKREVDKMIAAGAKPVPAHSCFAEVAEKAATSHEENCEWWRKRPTSWGDAIYGAFDICRREFRPD